MRSSIKIDSASSFLLLLAVVGMQMLNLQIQSVSLICCNFCRAYEMALYDSDSGLQHTPPSGARPAINRHGVSTSKRIAQMVCLLHVLQKC